MNNIVITSAKKYIDIDAYAACIAYSILLKSSNIKAKPVTTSLFNESIPEIIKNIDLGFEKYKIRQHSKRILSDFAVIRWWKDNIYRRA